MNYNTDRPLTPYDRLRAWVSRYAWGDDYHEILQSKLKELAAWIEQSSSRRTRTYVDTGPVLERVLRNTRALAGLERTRASFTRRPGRGFSSAASLPISNSNPTRRRPTDAAPARVALMPARQKRFSSLTFSTAVDVFHTRPLSCAGRFRTDRAGIGHHLFGCDICQDVCPWNRKAPYSRERRVPAEDRLFAGDRKAAGPQ